MISFSNEIARLCTSVGGVDAIDVMRGVHEAAYFTVRRAGQTHRAPVTSFLEPGCGFGGSCLPKDVTALIGQGQDKGVALDLLRSILDINRGQPEEMLRLIDRHFSSIEGVAVTIPGIAFKRDTDYVRESPAFPIIRKIMEKGARVTAYDPVARPHQHEDLDGVKLAGSFRAAVCDARSLFLSRAGANS